LFLSIYFISLLFLWLSRATHILHSNFFFTVSIKLVLRFPDVHKSLFSSVLAWIQFPFAEWENQWDLEELLVGASLVGIPWTLLRESFMRKLLVTLYRNANIQKKVSASERLKRMFELEENKLLIERILYEFSFLISSSKSIKELGKHFFSFLPMFSLVFSPPSSPFFLVLISSCLAFCPCLLSTHFPFLHPLLSPLSLFPQIVNTLVVQVLSQSLVEKI
jgi:hypothetical protein